MTKVIRANGCVVYRRTDSFLKVMLIHRPKYDDWTFPKGKKESHETDYECALRETLEETGAEGTTLFELSPYEYSLGSRRQKIVRYWAMRYESGDFVPNNEVDEILWLERAQVNKKLSYERDKLLFNEFLNKVS